MDIFNKKQWKRLSHDETLKFLCFIDSLDRYFRDFFFTLGLSGGSKDRTTALVQLTC